MKTKTQLIIATSAAILKKLFIAPICAIKSEYARQKYGVNFTQTETVSESGEKFHFWSTEP